MSPVPRRTFLRSSVALGAAGLLGGCGAATPPPADSRVLLAFFSRAGENYFNGGRTVLQVGNTAVVADLISSTIPVDVFEIRAADPYPDGYDATVARNVREQETEARPAITGALPTVEAYDTVLLGSGIWNVRPPMIMCTFVENVDLDGKTVLPFVTYAVSGPGRTVEDYTRLCPRSRIGDALAVRGEQARDARSDVEAWLRSTGLLAA